jgi:glycosyltransferase involved in cell wall biosynthesis
MEGSSVDVLLPFHKANEHFYSALKSLELSSYKNFNVILIDDCIQDCRSSIMKKLENYELRFLYVRTKGNAGYGLALKLGTSKINSKYVALMNSDDLIHPERFVKQIEAIKSRDLCFTKMSRINQFNQNLPFLFGSILSSDYDPIFLLLGSYGANATWLMTAEWWDKNCFFDSELGLDWRIAMKSFLHTDFIYLNEPLYYYRKHSLQSSRTERNYRNYDAIFRSWIALATELKLDGMNRDIFDQFVIPDKLDARSLSKNSVNFYYIKNEVLSRIHNKNSRFEFQRLYKRRILISNLINKKYSKNNLLELFWASSEIPALLKDLTITLKVYLISNIRVISQLISRYLFKNSILEVKK